MRVADVARLLARTLASPATHQMIMDRALMRRRVRMEEMLEEQVQLLVGFFRGAVSGAVCHGNTVLDVQQTIDRDRMV